MPPVSYPEFIERVGREQGHDRALAAAIGRYFDPVGEIEAIHAGDEAPVEFPDGLRFERLVTLGPIGQSVCILRRR